VTSSDYFGKHVKHDSKGKNSIQSNCGNNGNHGKYGNHVNKGNNNGIQDNYDKHVMTSSWGIMGNDAEYHPPYSQV
jgi:hypothetical protein